MSAVWITAWTRLPSVSVRMWRLRPLIFLRASPGLGLADPRTGFAQRPAAFRGFHALTVDHPLVSDRALTEDHARSPAHRFRNFLPHGRQPQKTLRDSICLGISAVDIGHSRLPNPPDKITGAIEVFCGMTDPVIILAKLAKYSLYHIFDTKIDWQI